MPYNAGPRPPGWTFGAGDSDQGTKYWAYPPGRHAKSRSSLRRSGVWPIDQRFPHVFGTGTLMQPQRQLRNFGGSPLARAPIGGGIQLGNMKPGVGSYNGVGGGLFQPSTGSTGFMPTMGGSGFFGRGARPNAVPTTGVPNPYQTGGPFNLGGARYLPSNLSRRPS